MHSFTSHQTVIVNLFSKLNIFIVVKYTNEQRLQIIKIFYRNSESVTATVENIAAVQASVANDPNQSIPRRSQELGIALTTLWRILRKDLGLHSYKIQLTQELTPMDHLKRRTFSDWVLKKMRQDDEFHRKIIFSDEAHFWLNGFLNKQNMRYCSGENPYVLHESPLHPQKITVWCGLHAGGVIGPYFFVDDNDRHVTVNGQRYRAMITDYFWPELEDMLLDDMWFQQDDATSHTAHATID